MKEESEVEKKNNIRSGFFIGNLLKLQQLNSFTEPQKFSLNMQKQVFLVPKRNPFSPLRLLSREKNIKSWTSIPKPSKNLAQPNIFNLNPFSKVKINKISIPCRKESIAKLCNQLTEYRKVSLWQINSTFRDV